LVADAASYSGGWVSTVAVFQEAREGYHAALIQEGVLSLSPRKKPKAGRPDQIPSNADGESSTSIAIAHAILDQIQFKTKATVRLAGQVSGNLFERLTQQFVEKTFGSLKNMRPGKWDCSTAKRAISRYGEYHHLAKLSELAKRYEALAAHLGHKSGYLIAPDILLVREPETDEVINAKGLLVDDNVARRSGLRKRNNSLPLLHASISCKWTLRSDRAQNARSEALNLIRNRKGRVPHIVVVTGEPLPSRLASLALGTGDIDCVYHFALSELIASVEKLKNEEALNVVKMLADGKRLKDIADLPLDLAV
jgi:NgoMIV restriction enzyme